MISEAFGEVGQDWHDTLGIQVFLFAIWGQEGNDHGL